VEFGFTPKDMASGEQTVFWWASNSTPPKDYTIWADLINKSVCHWIERYGIDEVLKWYFEVWNEPNLKPFWGGTKSQYFELYKITVKTIKAIDESLKVGGPATSNFVPDDRFDGEIEDKNKQSTFTSEDIDNANWRPVWVQDFLEYCAKENLPVDFISTHPYPTDTALDGYGNNKGYSRSIDATKQDLQKVRKIINNSDYKNAEIHLTEWNSSSTSRDSSHDFLTAAAFVTKTNIESTNTVNSLSYWTFTDVFEEGGAGNTIFHGGFGMINYQGIVKPSFHAYRFLSLLGDKEIFKTDGCIVTKHSKDKSLSILAYNYPDEVQKSVPMALKSNIDRAQEIQDLGTAKELSIKITNLTPETSLIIETVDKNNGFAISAWEKMGKPEYPNREQTMLLKQQALNTKKDFIKADNAGVLNLTIAIEPWSIVSIRENR
jgi:xylan 1,4-beta-xylosidase